MENNPKNAYKCIYFCVYIYVCVCVNHFVIVLKVTQYYKLTGLQFKKSILINLYISF